MSEQFLATEELLYELADELQRYRSAAEQLNLASDNTTEILQTSARIIDVGKQLVEQGKLQLNDARVVLQQAEAQVAQILATQKAVTITVESRLKDLNAEFTSLQVTLSQSGDAQAQISKHLDAVQASLTVNDKSVNSLTSIATSTDKRLMNLAEVVDLQGQRLVVLRNDFGTTAKQVDQLAEQTGSASQKLNELAAFQATVAQQIEHIAARMDQQDTMLSTLQGDVTKAGNEVLAVQKVLINDLRPQLFTLQRISRVHRVLLILVLLLMLGNVALAGYLVFLALQ